MDNTVFSFCCIWKSVSWSVKFTTRVRTRYDVADPHISHNITKTPPPKSSYWQVLSFWLKKTGFRFLAGVDYHQKLNIIEPIICVSHSGIVYIPFYCSYEKVSLHLTTTTTMMMMMIFFMQLGLHHLFLYMHLMKTFPCTCVNAGFTFLSLFCSSYLFPFW